MAGQYPFADAQQSFGGLGNQASHIAYMLAQRKYAQQVQLERIAAMMEAQKARQRSADERINMETPYYNARANRENQMAGRVGDIRDSATRAGSAYQRSMEPLPMNVDEGPLYEGASPFLAQMDQQKQVGQRGVAQGDRDSALRIAVAEMLRNQLLSNSPDPAKVVDFQTQQRALQAVGQMTPQQGWGVLSKTHSAVPLSPGSTAFNPYTGEMSGTPRIVRQGENLVPSQGGAPLAQGQVKPPSTGHPAQAAALNKLLSPEFGMLLKNDPASAAEIRYTATNRFYDKPINGPANQTPQISTKEDYDKLPSGSRYIGPDGKLATKR